MKMMDLIKVMVEYGLEEKEAKVYLALLDLGETTATKLSKETSLDRTLMYQITNKLIEKGLASYKIKGNVKNFSAADPQILLTNLKEKKSIIEEALPQLKARQKTQKIETTTEIFKGRKGVYSVLKLVMAEKKTYYFMGGMEESTKEFYMEGINLLREAKLHGAKGKVIVRESDKFPMWENEDYRIVPDDLLSTTSIAIVGDKTIIFVWSEPYYAIVIISEEVAKSNLKTFNYLWKIGKKVNKKNIKK